MDLKPSELMQIEVSVAYSCIIIKGIIEHSAFYKVIYSLNLDLANKCVPLKISTALLFYIIKHKKTVDKSIVFLYLEFMILL